MPYFDQSRHPPNTPPLEGQADRSLPPLAQHLGTLAHAASTMMAQPPSPSDFLFHGPKLPPIDSLRDLSSPLKLSSKKRKFDPPSPTHTVGTPPPRPSSHAGGFAAYAFKHKSRPSTPTHSSSSRSTIQQRRNGAPLAQMRRLDLSGSEDEQDDVEDDDDQGGEVDELASEGDNGDRKSECERDTPLREVTPTPSEASVELDDDYVPIPLNSIRSRGIGRAKPPPKATLPTKPKAALKDKHPNSKTLKPPSPKKLKLTRGAAGERRMSQNRSAQKKYRDKNKRLADLRSDFNLATIKATSDYKAGKITAADAIELLNEASDEFRHEMAATCGMTGQRLEEEITEMGA